MPVISAANVILDQIYRLPSSYLAGSWELVLFSSDPEDEADPLDVELADVGGYDSTARPVINRGTDWDAADGMSISTSAMVEFAATTAEWPDEALFWGLLGDDDLWYFTAPLLEPLEVTGAGDGPQVAVSVFIDESIEEPS